VVRSDGREFVLADIPGLIEGAHEGIGLGDRFLGHVERCRVLLHLVDGTQEDPAEAYRVVRGELEAYGGGLPEKREIVALSKADAIPAEELESRTKALQKASGQKPLVLSAATRQGIEAALRALGRVIDEGRVADPNDIPSPRPETWQP
jgi:GTP-binding protein